IPRKGFCSLSGTEIQSISRRMYSSASLALIGPPKMTAPACWSSVCGSFSSKRGRRTSRGKPNWVSAWPIRPGVECSWWRTIRIGCRIVASGRREESAPIFGIASACKFKMGPPSARRTASFVSRLAGLFGLAGNPPAQIDPFARRHTEQIGGAPQQIILELVALAVGVDDFPHHLDDLSAAFFVQRAVEETGEMIKVDGFVLRGRCLVDQFVGGGVVEREAALDDGVQ